MNHRKLGSAGPVVSTIGLGCMGMSDFYGERDQMQAKSVIHQAIDSGITFFDTADMYGVGDNEELVGKALGKAREDIVLATKFGNVRSKSGEFLGINGRPEYVKEACEASLRRLNTDYIDLYYQHRVDPDVPIEETVGAMADLVKEGKVRYLGLSEAAPKPFAAPIRNIQSQLCKLSIRSGAEKLKKVFCRHAVSSALGSSRTVRSGEDF